MLHEAYPMLIYHSLVLHICLECGYYGESEAPARNRRPNDSNFILVIHHALPIAVCLMIPFQSGHLLGLAGPSCFPLRLGLMNTLLVQ